MNTSKKNRADLVVLNGVIWTGDSQQPWAEALAISGDSIIAVGKSDEIQDWIGDSTKVIDANKQFITPGFIDSHVHFLEGGLNLASVQLRDAKTPQEFITRIKEYAKTLEPGTWITGGDWDHENWGGELPTKFWIDSVTPNNPVWINRLDGHSSLANSIALKLAGVTKKTADVNGGTIVKTEKGEPTGILKENATGLVDRIVPAATEAMKVRALEAAMNYVAQHGVTSVHNMTAGMEGFNFFETAAKNHKLKVRISCAAPLNSWKMISEKIKNEGNNQKWFRFGGVKAFLDGSLGSHTAAFKQPYTDKPTDKGLFVIGLDEFYDLVSKADKAGLQLMVHAIGDSAINVLLDTYQRVIKENGERDRRFRVEHTQHLCPTDIARFKELNVIASMQPYHAIDDGRWAEKIIGPERIKTTYAFRSLLDAGAKVCFGSDWFVAPPDPIMGIYAAVTRRTLDEKNPDGWVPEQKITVEEALRAYTIDAAYTSFEENSKGSLKAGKLADFVIMDRDLTKINPADIRNVKIMMTVAGGNIIYQK